MSEQQPDEDGTDPAETPGAQDSSGPGDSSGSSDSTDSGGSELDEGGPLEIGDDKLPEDLQPTEDNPLARHPGQTGEEDDKIGANIEGGEADNPSADMAYSSEDSNEPSEDDGDGKDGDDS